MCKDTKPGNSGEMLCPFCACLLFSSFFELKSNFTKTPLSSLSFQGNWGKNESLCMVKLVNLVNEFHPFRNRRVNITVAEILNYDSLGIKRFKDTKLYKECLAIVEDFDSGASAPCSSPPSFDTALSVIEDDSYVDLI